MKRPKQTILKQLRHILSIPFIWAMLVPTFFMHIAAFLYQAVCFRLYEIGPVKLRDFVSFDREKLGYLTWYDKFNCAYCSYANGVYSYVTEIGRRTEYYWCGIKHRSFPDNPAYSYQEKFAPYGDEEAFCKLIMKSGRIEK